MLRPMLEGSCRLPVFSRRKISLQRQDASMMRDTRLNNRVRTNWSFGNIRETADGCRILGLTMTWSPRRDLGTATHRHLGRRGNTPGPPHLRPWGQGALPRGCGA